MFGYVNVNQQELKIRDYRTYQAFYCGLCKRLKACHGQKSRLLLNYDMTFLVILLSGLYELPENEQDERCIVHPAKKHKTIWNEAADYGADMSILLAYQNMMDDWKDKHSCSKRAAAAVFEREYKELLCRYPRQGKALENYIRELEETEAQKETDIDRAAGLTGQLLAEIFVWREDCWQEEMRQMGFYLGKFIYLMDALEDMAQDEKAGRYNVFLLADRSDKQAFEDCSRRILTSMMAECSKAFERLPVLEYADILRNILYSGVWTKYELLTKEQKQKIQKK